MRRRNRSVLLWLSDAELYELKAKAERAGLSQQAFLRDLILGCEIHEALPVDFPPLIREMNRIGSNIGQILRIMNSNRNTSLRTMPSYSGVSVCLWSC